MRKKLLVLLFLCVLFTGCFNDKKEKKPVKVTDEIKFKEEYESLNGKKNKNGKEYVNISIPKDNKMVYATYDEIVDVIKNKNGVIYFGFPECPWCRNSVPILIDAINELGIDKIYYFNALDMRDEKKLDDSGNVVVVKEGTNEYKELLELLHGYISEYKGLNDPSIERLYFPTVIFVKNGEIIGSHVSTLESQTDPYKKLNKDEKQELKDIYLNLINQVYEVVCDDAC